MGADSEGICLSLLTIAYDLKLEYFKSKIQLQNLLTDEKIGLSPNHQMDDQDDEFFESLNNESYTPAEATDQEDENVELIVGESKYNMKDVLIVEETNDEAENTYDNFLGGLGTSVTASFSKTTANREESRHAEPSGESASNSSKVSSVSCEHCKRKFESAEYLKKHVVICEKFKKLECYACSKKFMAKRNLMTHIAEIHLIGKNVKIGRINLSEIDLQCKVCNKMCSNRKTLAYHVSLHKDGFSCDECGKVFRVKSVLAKHQQTHKRETKVVCPVCGKAFHYDTGLFYHMKIHNNDRKYHCSFCPRKFYNLCGLKRHERTHTDERPYPCPHCCKSFRSGTELKNHVYLHTGERPYKCEVCNIGFAKSYNMNVHLMTHEGSFNCNYCRKSFINEKVLKFHLNAKHNVKRSAEGDFVPENISEHDEDDPIQSDGNQDYEFLPDVEENEYEDGEEIDFI